MQQIFNFVLKNSNRLLFLLLLVISLSLTIQSHSYHKSKIISSANFFTGGIYEKINNVDEYFGLRKQNEELAQENARLKSILFNQKDTTKLPEIDTIVNCDKVFLNAVGVTNYLRNNYVDFFNAFYGINLRKLCSVFLIEQKRFQTGIFHRQFFVLFSQSKIFINIVYLFVNTTGKEISRTDDFTFVIGMRLNCKRK